MTCAEFRDLTGRTALSCTRAEIGAARSHVAGCRDCSSIILQWNERLRQKSERYQRGIAQLADQINAEVDDDPESVPAKGGPPR